MLVQRRVFMGARGESGGEGPSALQGLGTRCETPDQESAETGLRVWVPEGAAARPRRGESRWPLGERRCSQAELGGLNTTTGPEPVLGRPRRSALCSGQHVQAGRPAMCRALPYTDMHVPMVPGELDPGLHGHCRLRHGAGPLTLCLGTWSPQAMWQSEGCPGDARPLGGRGC